MIAEKQENNTIPKTNNRKKLLIAVIIIFILLMGLTFGFTFLQNTPKTSQVFPGAVPSPTPIKDNFYIMIKEGKFDPEKISIPKGARVFWKNADEKENSVLSKQTGTNDPTYLADFASPPLDKDERFSYIFSKKGTFTYYNSYNMQAVGTVEVR